MVKSIEAPDPYTVVFHLHYPAASFLTMLAHPANFIYTKKYLDQDPDYYKQHAMGTGPFKLKSYVRGSSLELGRNPNYWKQGVAVPKRREVFHRHRWMNRRLEDVWLSAK